MDRMIVLTLGVFGLLLGCDQRPLPPPPDPAPSARTEPPPEGPRAPGLPFVLGHDYRYDWEYRGIVVGKSVFRFALEEGEVACHAEVEYLREDRELQLEISTRFDERFKPTAYRLEWQSRLGTRIAKEWKEATFHDDHIEIVKKTNTEKEPRKLTIPAKGHYHLYANNGVHLWAVFAPQLLRFGGHRSQLRICFLDDESVNRSNVRVITFGREGQEDVRGVPCTRFRIEDPDLGTLWIAADGRLMKILDRPQQQTYTLVNR